jgi:hypothetical protein
MMRSINYAAVLESLAQSETLKDEYVSQHPIFFGFGIGINSGADPIDIPTVGSPKLVKGFFVSKPFYGMMKGFRLRLECQKDITSTL